MKYVVDFDDLCDERDPWDALMALKTQYPELRVTLFAIPGRCSDELLAKYTALNWVQLGVHGYWHSSMECAIWTYEETLAKLAEISAWWPGARLFKAPGWIANEEVYRALCEGGWCVADNALHADAWADDSNAARYVYNATLKTHAIHGHTWDVCDNGPSRWQEMFAGVPTDATFLFVTEAAALTDQNDIVQHVNSSWSHKSPYGVRAAKRLAEFMEAVKPVGPVADFGGNDGYAAHQSGRGIVEVVDGNLARAGFARSQYGLVAHVEDFANLPFGDQHFEWGFTSHTLEHLPNLDECWAGMKRVCKVGIWVVVPVESQESFDLNPAHLVRHTHEEWLEHLGAVELMRTADELLCKWVRP